MSATSLQSKNSLKISCPSSIAFLHGYTDSESTKNKCRKRYKKKPRHTIKKQSPNGIRKLQVYPSKELHQKWKQWLAAYRWIYNWSIAYLKSASTQLESNSSWKARQDKEQVTAYTLSKIAREADRPDWVKELPGHQLQEAVADAVDATKQAKVNQGFTKFKSCRATSQTIKFKVGNFRRGTWYPKLTKGLNFTTNQALPQECIYGTQLVYQRMLWIACFPEYREETNSGNNRVIALDPGNRTFLTGYDGENILEIGKKDIGRINRFCTHLDQLMSRISKCKIKRQRYKMRQAASGMRGRLQDIVKDLHNKAASFLVRHYKVIFLPTFSTSEMVLKSKRKLNSKAARNMLTWCHYKFAQNPCSCAAAPEQANGRTSWGVSSSLQRILYI